MPTETKNNIISDIPWKFIISAIIFLVIIFSCKKVLDALESIAEAFAEAVGPAAKLAASVFSDCTDQYDCTVLPCSNQCTSTYGCACTKDQKSCQIINGRKPGPTGVFGCTLYIFLFGWIFAPLILGFVKFFYTGTKDVVKYISKMRNKPAPETGKDLTIESMADVYKFKEDYKKANNKDLSDDAVKAIEKIVINGNIETELRNGKDKLPATSRDAILNDSKIRWDAITKEVQEAKDKLTEQAEKDAIDKAAEDFKPPEILPP